MKIMVAYDGTLQAKDALKYGIGRAKEKNAELIVSGVFDTGMFFAYEASRDARDEARTETTRFVSEAEEILRAKGAGVKASLVTMEGNPEREVLAFAKQENVDVLLCPPRFSALISKYRKALEKEGRTVDVADAGEMKLATVAARN
jgi:nucleotide-binding universal stress UspA family protein